MTGGITSAINRVRNDRNDWRLDVSQIPIRSGSGRFCTGGVGRESGKEPSKRSGRPSEWRRLGAVFVLVLAASSGVHCASSSDLGFETGESLDPMFMGTRHVAERTAFGIRVQVEQLSGMIVYDLECERWGEDYHLTPERHSGTAPVRTIFDVRLPAQAPRDAKFYWVTREGWLPVWAKGSAEPSQRVEVELNRDVVFDEGTSMRMQVDCV